MTQEVIWRADDGIGSEYLFLRLTDDGIEADSVVFATREVAPSRTWYRAEMDREWRVRRVQVRVSNAGVEDRGLDLRSDGQGHWSDAEGRHLGEFDGCVDIDISATPFTNTLPIRRLGLQSGQVEVIRVLYIHIPSLHVEPLDQRYTRLDANRVRYESLDAEFMRELEIDDDGLVVAYPGLFTRVFAS